MALGTPPQNDDQTAVAMRADAVIRLRELAKVELWCGRVEVATQLDEIADQIEDTDGTQDHRVELTVVR